jgi:hypothetical protein
VACSIPVRRARRPSSAIIQLRPLRLTTLEPLSLLHKKLSGRECRLSQDRPPPPSTWRSSPASTPAGSRYRSSASVSVSLIPDIVKTNRRRSTSAPNLARPSSSPARLAKWTSSPMAGDEKPVDFWCQLCDEGQKPIARRHQARTRWPSEDRDSVVPKGPLSDHLAAAPAAVSRQRD